MSGITKGYLRKRLEELKNARLQVATNLAQFDAAIAEYEMLLQPQPKEPAEKKSVEYIEAPA